MKREYVEFCECELANGTYTETNDFGWWDMCVECNKVIDGTFEFHSSGLED